MALSGSMCKIAQSSSPAKFQSIDGTIRLKSRHSPMRSSTASSTTPIASIWPETACESHARTPEIGAHLTPNDIRNMINLDLRKQAAGGRHQIGTLAGFRSEWAAGFVGNPHEIKRMQKRK